MAEVNIPDTITFSEANYEISALKTILTHIPHLIHAALDQYQMSTVELKIIRDAYKILATKRKEMNLLN